MEDLPSAVDALFERSDAALFVLFHQIAASVMEPRLQPGEIIVVIIGNQEYTAVIQ